MSGRFALYSTIRASPLQPLDAQTLPPSCLTAFAAPCLPAPLCLIVIGYISLLIRFRGKRRHFPGRICPAIAFSTFL